MDLELLNKPIDKRVKGFIVRALRRFWLYWEPRQTVVKNAMVSRGFYKCNVCKGESFKRNELHVDHIEPVQNVQFAMTTWYDLILWITRLYVDVDKLQAICPTCHDIKTRTENNMRKFYKAKNKPPVKKKTPK